MAERLVYSCDWCAVDSPMSGSIPGDWAVVDDVLAGYGSGKAHLCPPCKQARVRANQDARAARYRETHPIPCGVLPTGGEEPRGGSAP